jgi:hypothetical protein
MTKKERSVWPGLAEVSQETIDNASEGMPDDTPEEVRRRLAECYLRHSAADPLAVEAAILMCGMFAVPLPAWVNEAVFNRLSRYLLAQVDTWGQACGVPDKKHGKAKNRRALLAWPVYQYCEENRPAPLNELFRLAAEKFSISQGTAETYYYHIKDALAAEGRPEDEDFFFFLVRICNGIS